MKNKDKAVAFGAASLAAGIASLPVEGLTGAALGVTAIATGAATVAHLKKAERDKKK